MISKEVWIGWVSSAVEAYNMAIYSFIAPLIAKLIFQDQGAGSSLLFSYSLIFIGSSLLYPAGAFYYGLIGDKKGRQHTCIYSTLGLAAATGFMALVPASEYAWVLFLILIGAQNFFSGGEYYGSIVFSLEHSSNKQTGLLSALSCLFAVFGLVAANGLTTVSFLMDNQTGIQLCFLVGGIGGILSYILKNHCQETPAFTSLSQKSLEDIRISSFIKDEWRKLVSVVGVFAFFIVSYSFLFIFLPLVPFDLTSSYSFDTFKSLIAYGILLVAAGWTADRFGIEKVMFSGAALFALSVVPMCLFCKNLGILQLVLTVFASLTIGPIHSWMVSQFEARSRCRGIFISSAIATSIFGGSTVPVCLLIFEQTASLALCAIYPMIVALGAMGCLMSLKQKEVLA